MTIGIIPHIPGKSNGREGNKDGRGCTHPRKAQESRPPNTERSDHFPIFTDTIKALTSDAGRFRGLYGSCVLPGLPSTVFCLSGLDQSSGRFTTPEGYLTFQHGYYIINIGITQDPLNW